MGKLQLNETESEKKAKVAGKVAAELAPQVFKLLHLNTIKESPNNPRKYFDEKKLAELAQDIRVHGVLQPVLVRPLGGDKYELVAGHRRLRAAREAGLADIPALISELSDLEAAERRVVENDQREDLTPLERAQGYLALKKDHKLTDEEIAAKVGKSPSSIRAALKLGDLAPEALKWLEKGLLTASTALRVARVPRSMQAQLLKAVEDDYEIGDTMAAFDDLPISDRALRDLIRRDFMLELGKGKSCFSVDDATLADAPACTLCPKRTGADPEFHGEKEKDLCTDPVCYRTKETAFLKREEEKGKRVLVGKAAEKVLSPNGGVLHGSGFVAADDKRDFNAKKTFGELVDKDKIILAQDPNGGVVKLVAKEDLPPAPKAQPREKSAEEKKWEKQQADYLAEQQRKKALNAKLIPKLVEHVERKLTKAQERLLWQFLAHQALDYSDCSEVFQRRGLADVDEGDAIDKFSLEEARSFVFECHHGYRSYGDIDWAKEFKVDKKKLEAEVKAEAKAAEKESRHPGGGEINHPTKPAAKAGKKKAA